MNNWYNKFLDSEAEKRSELEIELNSTLWDRNSPLSNLETLLSIFGYATLRMGLVGDTPGWNTEVDSVHSYRQNSYGYRDSEYSIANDILVAGCSQTFGQGIHEDARWGNLLAKKLNMSVSTLAVPGWSTQSAVSSLFHHIKQYGKPKIIALLAPDFSRFQTIINSEYCSESGDSVDPAMPARLSHLSKSSPNSGGPKYAKRPFPLNEIINSESTYYLSGQSIAALAEYCREAGIRLVWTTWDPRVDYLVRYIRDYSLSKHDIGMLNNLNLSKKALPYIDLSEYIDMQNFYTDNNGEVKLHIDMDCHKELRETYGSCCFDLGTDKQMHMGVHMHAHIADAFYERLKE